MDISLYANKQVNIYVQNSTPGIDGKYTYSLLYSSVDVVFKKLSLMARRGQPDIEVKYPEVKIKLSSDYTVQIGYIFVVDSVNYIVLNVIDSNSLQGAELVNLELAQTNEVLTIV